MSAYLIADIEVLDSAEYETYRQQCRPPFLPSAGATWCAAARSRCSKARGRPSAA